MDEKKIHGLAEEIVGQLASKYQEMSPEDILVLLTIVMQILRVILEYLNRDNLFIKFIRMFPIASRCVLRRACKDAFDKAEVKYGRYQDDIYDLIVERVIKNADV